MNKQGSTIQIGDGVVIYERFDCITHIVVAEDGKYKTKWGEFATKDWVGLPFGSKVVNKSGYVYLLAPTPELWTLVLRHRTQILYLADIATVCMRLELKPGCIVFESGTGSGSLTTSLARAIAPTGHVNTFEFHEKRAEIARDEFKQNGIGDYVTVTHRDIEANGFPVDEWKGKVDAVFLDLPGPWKAVPSAVACLRENGMICSFSPCIEQVQQTCEMLNAHGCMDICSLEILLRDIEAGNFRLMKDLLLTTSPSSKDLLEGNGGDTTETEVDDNTTKRVEGEDGQVVKPTSNTEKESSKGADGEGGNGNNNIERIVLGRPAATGKGHTGYLTFARKPPSVDVDDTGNEDATTVT